MAYGGAGVATQTVVAGLAAAVSNAAGSPLLPGDYLLLNESGPTVYAVRGTAHNTPAATSANATPVPPGTGYQFTVTDLFSAVDRRAWISVISAVAGNSLVTLSRQDTAGLTVAPPALVP